MTARTFSPHAAWGKFAEHIVATGHVIVGASVQIPDSFQPNSIGDFEIFPSDITDTHHWEIPVEDAAILALHQFMRSNDYPRTHAVLLWMMSRRDSTGTFRTLDREIVLRRLNLALFSQILRSRPSHIVFDETPHEVVDFALFKIAEFLSIKTLFFQTSLLGPQMVARTSIDKVLEVDCVGIGSTSNESDRQRVQEISMATILKLCRGEGTVLVDRQIERDRNARTVSQRVRAGITFLKSLRNPPSAVETSFSGHRGIAGMRRRVLQEYLEWSLRSSLVGAIKSLPAPELREVDGYVLFALHYEPERTSMPEGLPFLSQFDAVLAARSMVPPHLKLLVKEHYAQQSSALRGYVGRSVNSYRYLNSIPGVEVVGLDSNARTLASRAECVMTMTGKIAIEALFLGTPAIYFGQPWWAGLPGTLPYRSGLNWKHIESIKIPSESELFAWLESKFSTSLLFGLGGTSPEKYSERNARLPPRFAELEAESLIRAFTKFLQ